jgi:hypothetical protein
MDQSARQGWSVSDMTYVHQTDHPVSWGGLLPRLLRHTFARFAPIP